MLMGDKEKINEYPRGMDLLALSGGFLNRLKVTIYIPTQTLNTYHFQ